MDRLRAIFSDVTLHGGENQHLALSPDDDELREDDFGAGKTATATPWYTRILRSPKDRRRGVRLLLPCTVALIVVLAVTLSYRSYSSTRKPTWNKVLDTRLGTGCNDTRLAQEAMDEAFWDVNIEPPHVIVRPKDWETYKNCHALASAFFTVRLLFANDDIRLLDDPLQTRPGEYQFDLVAPLGPQASNAVSVEAILELASYPGGSTGMPCSTSACNYTTLLDEGIDWVGQPILTEQNSLPQYYNSLPSLSLPSDTTPLCPHLDNLPGVYNNASALFTPIGPDGLPCRLLQVDTALAAPPIGELRWWRFLGDSNMRFFFAWNYPKKMGAVTCVKSVRKTRSLCWDETTAWSWDWFFGAENATDTNVRLTRRLDETLHGFMHERKDDPWDFRWHGTGDEGNALPTQFDNFTKPAERIYISFGSHASQLTTKGWREVMEAVTPTLQHYADAIVVVLTSATAPARIPVKYIKDRVMRHNIQIKASNEVIASYAGQLGLRVLDIFSLTRTVGAGNMIDNVHFPSTIYNIWTSVYFTERFGAASR